MPGQERRGRHTWVCVFESGWETRTKRWYWQRGIGTQTSKGRGWMDGGGSRLLGVETEAERGWINKLRYRLPFAVCSSHLWDTQQDPNDYVYDSSSYSSGREESTVWLLCELFFFLFLSQTAEWTSSFTARQTADCGQAALLSVCFSNMANRGCSRTTEFIWCNNVVSSRLVWNTVTQNANHVLFYTYYYLLFEFWGLKNDKW